MTTPTSDEDLLAAASREGLLALADYIRNDSELQAALEAISAEAIPTSGQIQRTLKNAGGPAKHALERALRPVLERARTEALAESTMRDVRRLSEIARAAIFDPATVIELRAESSGTKSAGTAAIELSAQLSGGGSGGRGSIELSGTAGGGSGGGRGSIELSGAAGGPGRGTAAGDWTFRGKAVGKAPVAEDEPAQRRTNVLTDPQKRVILVGLVCTMYSMVKDVAEDSAWEVARNLTWALALVLVVLMLAPPSND